MKESISTNNLDFINISIKYFEARIYSEEWAKYSDKDIIIQDYIEFVNELKFPDKIRLFCYYDYYNKNDMMQITNTKTENYIKRIISELNKKGEFLTEKRSKLQHYITSPAGKNLLKTAMNNFVLNNKYIRKQLEAYKSSKENQLALENIKNQDYLIKKIHKYLSEYQIKNIQSIVSGSSPYLELDHSDILEYDYELADEVLSNPDNILSVAKEVSKLFYDSNQPENFFAIKLKNLPEVDKIEIGTQRIENLNRLVSMTGRIKTKSGVNPTLQRIDYICSNPACSCSENQIKVPQIEEKVRKLKSCPKCKSPIEEINREYHDSMFVIIENEFDSELESQKIYVTIDKELTNQTKYNKLQISNKVEVIGILKRASIPTKGGAESINNRYYIESNNIIFIDDEQDFSISKEEEKKFQSFKNDEKLLAKFVGSFASNVSGYEEIKKALILQHCGAPKLGNERSDSHILLIGDPSLAKSKIIRKSITYSRRGIIASGASSSKAGLGGTCIKDEITGTWIIEPGVLPRANNSILAIDELDNLREDDLAILHNSLEDQVLEINKAVRATLQTKCPLLAGANPKYGMFQNGMDVTKQISFPAPLLSRFDLIFILRDVVDSEKDSTIANKVISLYNGEDTLVNNDNEIGKYLQWCKSNFNPIIPENIKEYISRLYVELRQASKSDESINILPRHIAGIIRLSLSHARFHQKKELDIIDVNVAKSLFLFSIKDIGIESFNNINNKTDGSKELVITNQKTK